MKKIWLQHPAWGIKRVLFCIFCMLLLVYTWEQAAYLIHNDILILIFPLFIIVTFWLLDLILFGYFVEQYRSNTKNIYEQIIVRDQIFPLHRKMNIRCLITDSDKHQSGLFLSSRETAFPYQKTFWVSRMLVPIARNVLFLGGGGCSLPEDVSVHWPSINIDVVERSAEIISCAKYFLSDASRVNILRRDALSFLKTNKKKYDCIYVDIITSSSLPRVMRDSNFYKTLAQAIKVKNSVIFINCINRYDGINIVFPLIKKYFSRAYAFAFSRLARNTVLLLTNNSTRLSPSDMAFLGDIYQESFFEL